LLLLPAAFERRFRKMLKQFDALTLLSHISCFASTRCDFSAMRRECADAMLAFERRYYY